MLSLRQILGIPAAFVSRISNDTVRQRAMALPLSAGVANAQLALMDAVLKDHRKLVLREVAFQGTSMRPLTDALQQ